MTIYVIIAFVSILIGLFISLAVFGTAEKLPKVFTEIYYSISSDKTNPDRGILYLKSRGEYASTIRIKNPIAKYSADIDGYYDFTTILVTLMSTIGEDYSIHKQDVFVRRKYHHDNTSGMEFLSQAYFRYYEGREYTDCTTYLTITQKQPNKRFFSYDKNKWTDFNVKIQKALDFLRDRGVEAHALNKEELKDYVNRFYSQDFTSEVCGHTSYKVDDEYIGMGDRKMKIYSIFDVDSLGVPSNIKPYMNIEVNNASMPVDVMHLLEHIPEVESVVFNQIVILPGQRKTLNNLAKKKKRHMSVPTPVNNIAVEDISKVEEVIARENKMLVYAHFNLMVTIKAGVDIQKCTNHIENAFSQIGIEVSKRSYNQMELFINSFPGNEYGMSKDYDRYLILADAAACMMYKEGSQKSETSPLKVFYTDRQGVPIGIDITGKEGKTKFTDNSNFFCLGPSGSGKSFHMNSVVRQMWEQNTDIVMVDTGNSYINTCRYFNGKYISYTEEHPITMNPFRIRLEERNNEKIDFLKNLIMLIWKGNGAVPDQTELSLIEDVINDYYDDYFYGFKGYDPAKREGLALELEISLRSEGKFTNRKDLLAEVERIIKEMEDRRKELKVESLSFNTFYEYSIQRLPDIVRENKLIGIDISNYQYRIKRFFKGGIYDRILNEDVDSSLFDETFIVFEIDTIKDNETLFPIVTLIIMDVFIQKMRHKNNRKMLVIEEAWKAIASPMMAEYIKYLYKTVRKFWGIVGVVTQELGDIISSPIVKEAIINNSDVMMLLDQSKFKDRFDDIKSVLGLTDIECKKIFTINRLDNKANRAYFREVFIRRGITSDVYGVEEPSECYFTYTTERAEKEALDIYERDIKGHFETPKERHQAAIAKLCSDERKSGATSHLEFSRKVNAAGRILNL